MDPSKLDRTWLCTVLFMDIVGYSTRSVQLQAKLKERFTQYLSTAIRDVAENDRVLLDTGDGAAVCFLGAPEAAMFTGLALRSAFVHDSLEHDNGLKVRMGINLGPVKLVRDVNDNLNAIGDGINTGQRVMSFAGENQVLVSRSFFEVVSCLSEDYQRLFRYEGSKKDKHVREHLVYQLVPPGQEFVAPPAGEYDEHVVVTPKDSGSEYEALSQYALSVELAEPFAFDLEMLASLRALLAPVVGPIAGHLVKQASEHARDATGLVQELAAQINRPKEREKFVATASRLAGVAIPNGGESSSSPAAEAAPPAWDEQWLEKARKELTAHVGPMARVLVDRAAKRFHSRQEFCDALATELPPAEREKFLKVLNPQ
jgi:class 3 adenylate cyclase